MCQEGEKLFLIEYGNDVKGYSWYDPLLQTVTVARDVVVMEKENETSSNK